MALALDKYFLVDLQGNSSTTVERDILMTRIVSCKSIAQLG